MKKMLAGMLLFVAGIVALSAQVRILTDDGEVRVGQGGISVDSRAAGVATTAGSGNTAHTTVGSIEPGANVQGVTVINGKVWIDGEAVPEHATRFKAKSGTVYKIIRKGSNVSVTSE